VLDIAVAEIGLHGAGIMAFVGQSKTAGVSQHVRVGLEAEPCRSAGPLDHAGEPGGGERCASFGRKYKCRFGFLFALQTAQGAEFTRRAIFWENAVNKLIELTADDPGLHVDRHDDTISFIFDDAVLVRLKKADMALRTSNIPTAQARLFHDHREDLFGYEGLQRVEAVYIPNRFETGIVWSGIVARDQQGHLWHFELTEPVVVPVVPVPMVAQPPAASLARLRGHPQDGAYRKEKGDGGK